MNPSGELSERQKIEEYLKFYCIQECLDEAINELVETRPSNPYVSLISSMEKLTMAEILDVSVRPTFVGRGHAGVICTVSTNIGQFTGTAGYPYDAENTPISRDFTRVEESLRNSLCKLDPRQLAEVDKALDHLSELDKTVSMAASIACCRAGARHQGIPLFKYLSEFASVSDKGSLDAVRSKMRIPLPVMTVLSRAKAEEGAQNLTQDVSVIPTGAVNLSAALAASQQLFRAVVKRAEDKKVPLTVGDFGSVRAVLPNVDDAVKFVVDAIADSHAPGGLKPAVDFRASDFSKKPAGDAAAPAAGEKVEYMFHSPAAPVPTWSTAAAAAAAAVPDPKDKGAKGKKDAKAAAAAAEVPVSAGLDAEAHLQQVSKTWRELEFISLEDPAHPDDAAALKSLKTKLNEALQSPAAAAPAEGATGADAMAYSKSGVGGDSGCLLQVVADSLVHSVEDIQKLKQAGGAFNTVKIRLDKVSSVSKAVALCRAARDSGYAVVVGCSETTPETLDTFIADFAVAVGAGQLAAGGIASGEHFCKYSRLSEIAAEDPSIPFTAGDSFRL